MQLATIKAKSEALRLRQEFELEKFRAKYCGTEQPPDSPEHAAGPADGTGTRHPGAAAAAAGAPDALCSSSDGTLSIGAEEAFDEPLKVRLQPPSPLHPSRMWPQQGDDGTSPLGLVYWNDIG